MNVMLISPYHSGSHQAWAAGWMAHTSHNMTLLSLPGRFWKWRMQGAAVTLARQFLQSPTVPDVIVADDMLDLATFMALTRKKTAGVPVVLYMHENQVTYPLPENPKSGPMRRNWGVRERAYGLLNWKAMLTADQIWFNSEYHRHIWFEALPLFLKHYQEYRELETIPDLKKKSHVMPVGVESPSGSPASHSLPLILWNQRWEFDKNPAGFFAALAAVQKQGLSFQLAICGENFQKAPQPFLNAQQQFKNELIHFGYADPARYGELLWEADVTISTAYHEFFGISMVEAIMAQTFPILPNRLSYPELLPEKYHRTCLYHTAVELVEKICWSLTHVDQARQQATLLANEMKKYDSAAISVQYDQKLSLLKRFI